MTAHKCKNSVFCVSFLLCFLAGTICGVFCFSCASSSLICWQWHIDLNACSAPAIGLLCSFFRPLLVAAVFGISPLGRKYVWLLIGMRGLLCSYLCCAVIDLHNTFSLVILREFLLLPVFYWLCFWAYFRWDFSHHVH